MSRDAEIKKWTPGQRSATAESLLRLHLEYHRAGGGKGPVTKCQFDSEGLCQEHMLDKPCTVAATAAFIEELDLAAERPIGCGTFKDLPRYFDLQEDERWFGVHDNEQARRIAMTTTREDAERIADALNYAAKTRAVAAGAVAEIEAEEAADEDRYGR